MFYHSRRASRPTVTRSQSPGTIRSTKDYAHAVLHSGDATNDENHFLRTLPAITSGQTNTRSGTKNFTQNRTTTATINGSIVVVLMGTTYNRMVTIVARDIG